MWREESGFLEMFMSYYGQFGPSAVANNAYRDFLYDVLSLHERNQMITLPKETIGPESRTQNADDSSDGLSITLDEIDPNSSSQEPRPADSNEGGSVERSLTTVPETRISDLATDAVVLVVEELKPEIESLETSAECLEAMEVEIAEVSNDQYFDSNGFRITDVPLNALCTQNRSAEEDDHSSSASDVEIISVDLADLANIEASTTAADDPERQETAADDPERQETAAAAPVVETTRDRAESSTVASCDVTRCIEQARQILDEASANRESTDRPAAQSKQQYKCFVCHKTFSQLGTLISHERRHARKQSFDCKVCKKSFTEPEALRSHELIHSEERPYTCKACKKSFRRSEGLQAHQRIHAWTRSYDCEFCEKSFHRNKKLQMHIKTSHPEVQLSAIASDKENDPPTSVHKQQASAGRFSGQHIYQSQTLGLETFRSKNDRVTRSRMPEKRAVPKKQVIVQLPSVHANFSEGQIHRISSLQNKQTEVQLSGVNANTAEVQMNTRSSVEDEVELPENNSEKCEDGLVSGAVDQNKRKDVITPESNAYDTRDEMNTVNTATEQQEQISDGQFLQTDADNNEVRIETDPATQKNQNGESNAHVEDRMDTGTAVQPPKEVDEPGSSKVAAKKKSLIIDLPVFREPGKMSESSFNNSTITKLSEASKEVSGFQQYFGDSVVTRETGLSQVSSNMALSDTGEPRLTLDDSDSTIKTTSDHEISQASATILKKKIMEYHGTPKRKPESLPIDVDFESQSLQDKGKAKKNPRVSKLLQSLARRLSGLTSSSTSKCSAAVSVAQETPSESHSESVSLPPTEKPVDKTLTQAPVVRKFGRKVSVKRKRRQSLPLREITEDQDPGQAQEVGKRGRGRRKLRYSARLRKQEHSSSETLQSSAPHEQSVEGKTDVRLMAEQSPLPELRLCSTTRRLKEDASIVPALKNEITENEYGAKRRLRSASLVSNPDDPTTSNASSKEFKGISRLCEFAEQLSKGRPRKSRVSSDLSYSQRRKSVDKRLSRFLPRRSICSRFVSQDGTVDRELKERIEHLRSPRNQTVTHFESDLDAEMFCPKDFSASDKKTVLSGRRHHEDHSYAEAFPSVAPQEDQTGTSGCDVKTTDVIDPQCSPANPSIPADNESDNLFSSDALYPCKLCKKTFRRQETLSSHVRVHVLQRKIQEKSMRRFKNKIKRELDASTPSSSKDSKLREKSSGRKKQQVAELPSESRTPKRKAGRAKEQKTGKRLVCRKCPRKFNRAERLVAHMLTHTKRRVYVCNICRKIISGSRVQHLRTHTGERPYQCEHCVKSFAQKGALGNHLRTHTKERPFQCGTCSKGFTQLASLQSHERIHTGEKPFECDTCDKCFSQLSSLRLHQHIHLEKRPFSCDECGMSFNQSVSLRKHTVKHHAL